MNNIDRSVFLMKAAEESLLHAEESLKRQSWNMCIRRSQETVELALTAILARIGIHYPKNHDQAPLLFRVLDANGITVPERDKIERISIDLSRKRGPALHQEEGYDQKTATKALSDARFVYNQAQSLAANIQ